MTTLLVILLVAIAVLILARWYVFKPDSYTGGREKLYFGYYGDTAQQYDEVEDHVNLVWIAAWDRHPKTWVECQFERTVQAAQDGNHVVIMMTNNTYVNNQLNLAALDELDELFKKLSATPYLKHIAAVYPVDEPDGSNIDSAEIERVNSSIRTIMMKYPELDKTALAVFYTGSEKYPGIEYYDWVGFDEYHHGTRVLGAKYRRMLQRLRNDQRTMIIPGGCDKWRQDPRPFVDFALSNPRVIAVVPFIWLDNAAPENTDVGLGIRSNGLSGLYRESGRSIKLGIADLPLLASG